MNKFVEEQSIPQLPNVGMDALMRAEIDVQISTAHAYPRSLTKVARNVASLVTISSAAAEECIFSLPRGGKPIVGPSIRLAEILFSQWGNCTGGSRTVEVNKADGYVEAEGVFHDLETNAKTVRRVRRSIKDRNGRIYKDDMIIVTSNAAGAIAFRNSVLAGVPRAVWGDAYMTAEKTIRGDVKTLPERRDSAMKAMAAFGLSADDVYAILAVGGINDIGLDEILVLGGLHNSLKEGETTAEKLREEAVGAPEKATDKGSEPEQEPDAKQDEVPKAETKKQTAKKEKPATKEAEQDKTENTGPTDDEMSAKLVDLVKDELTNAVDLGEIEGVLELYGEQIEQMKGTPLFDQIQEAADERREALA